MIHPPSPALSAYDPLDGIDDLDAFLASMGPLSHFPTPPPPRKKDSVVEAIQALEELAQRDAVTQDYNHAALILAQQATFGDVPSPGDLVAIRAVLTRARLPLEIVAIALNILTSIRAHNNPTESLTRVPPDLLLVAALSLAITYTRDASPRASWWSDHVCDGIWITARIDKTIRELLVALDFRLHFCSDEIKLQDALLRLSSESNTGVDDPGERMPGSKHILAKNPLQLIVEGTSTLWQNGQLTPESCSSPMAPDCPLPLASWVPLL